MKHVALERLMAEILDNACPNGGVGEHQKPPIDWNVYLIETHCITWKVTAKKYGNGEWHILRAEAQAS